MNNENSGSKSKTGIIIAGIAAIIILILFMFNSCGSNEVGPNASADLENTGTATNTAIDPTDKDAENFYNNKVKHGTVTFKSGVSDPAKVEYWFDSDRYRLTWYNDDGTERLHMICPDGENLYYCTVKTKKTTVAYIRPEFHQWIFNGSSNIDFDSGVKEGDYNVYTVTLKKLWDIEGASQTFYCEDIKIYSDGEKIAKVETRTSSRKPASEDDLVTSTYTINTIEYLESIPDDVFELKYPIEE